jgi:predicted metal-binding protein
MHQLTTNKLINKQPNKQVTKYKLFVSRRAKRKAASVCQFNQSWNGNSCLININRECVSEGADVLAIRTVNCLPEKFPLTIILLGENLWMEDWKLNPNGLCQ